MGLLPGKTSDGAKARDALAGAEELLARWEAEVAAKAAELADLQARAGDEALADPAAAGSLARQMADLVAGVDVARRAVAAAVVKVSACRPPVLRARAVELRAEATTLKADAGKHQLLTDKLLADLLAHEGVPFGVAPVSADPGLVGSPMYPFTQSQRMLQRAKACEHQAAELDRIAEHGSDVERAGRVAALAAA